MRYMVIFVALIFASTFVFAGDVEGWQGKINASRIIEKTPGKCVGGVVIPASVRYVRNGDAAPSCGLLLKSGEYVDFVSPEVGYDFPACAAPLKKPKLFKLGKAYIVYEYSVEDPRAQFTRTYQLFRLDNDQVEACGNDRQLTDLAKRKIRRFGVEKAFKDAVGQLGCK